MVTLPRPHLLLLRPSPGPPLRSTAASRLAPGLRFLATTAALGCLGACHEAAESIAPDVPLQPALVTSEAPVVYGEDDRFDWYAHPDDSLRALTTNAIVALIPAGSLDERDPDNIRVTGRTLGEGRNLCEGELFADQPTAANCSGTLIANDLVLTAGHCVEDRNSCRGYRYVFDYYYRAEGELETIDPDDVFRCDDIVVRALADGTDYAILRLDRPVPPNRRPAPVRPADLPLLVDDPVTIIGFGSGLPAKIDNGGRVLDPRDPGGAYFDATTDAFGGNSGSGVFDGDGRLVGVLVRGATDYVTEDGCTRVNRLPEESDEDDFGEDVVYVARALEALCDSGDEGPLCGGPIGWCSACESESDCAEGFACFAPGEGAIATCTAICTGDADCRADHTCVDGLCVANTVQACERGDVSQWDACGRRLGVLTDCDDASEVCVDAACIAAGPGNTCADVQVIEPVDQTLRVTLDQTYSSAASGSCGGAGRDAFWQFTLTEPAAVQAVADGSDPVLYLRGDCADPESEVVCNDDISREDQDARIRTSLQPGTWTLVLDAYRSSAAGEFSVDLDFEIECECETGDIVCDGDSLLLCAATDGPCPRFATRRRCQSGRVCWEGDCIASEPGDTCSRALDMALDEPAFGDLGEAHGNSIVASCGGAGRDAFHRVQVDRAGTLRIVAEGTGLAVSVRAGCEPDDEELACEAATAASAAEAIDFEVDVSPGEWLVAVDTLASGGGGPYSLFVSFVPGCIDECDVDGQTQCVTASAERACADLDGDGCREWGEAAPCADGLVCTTATGYCAEPPVEPDAGPQPDAGVDTGDVTDEGSGGIIIAPPREPKRGCAAAGGSAMSAGWLLLLLALRRRRC